MNHQSRFDAGYRKLGAGALGWPRGMAWGGRWEWGFRMGNTCTAMADLCQCMAKTTTILKIKVEKKKEKIISSQIFLILHIIILQLWKYSFGFIFNASSNPSRPKLNPLNICHLLCCSLKFCLKYSLKKYSKTCCLYN